MEGKVEADNLIATIFHCLGYSPNSKIRDNFDRPIPISRMKIIQTIL
jgi:hypothetical protein